MLENYAPLTAIDEIHEELKSKANQYDFNKVYFIIDELKKVQEDLVTKALFNSKYTDLRKEMQE